MQFFQPKISITHDGVNGALHLRCLTLVPSGHYSEGAGTDGLLPAGIVVVPETRPVTLDIAFNPGPATQCVKLLRHDVVLAGLTAGHSTVTAFTTLQGAVVGAASLGLPNKAAEALLSAQESSLTARSFAKPAGHMAGAVPGPSWAAWIDEMPFSPRSLHVMGSVTVGNPGVEVSLKRAVPQGFNPHILLLDLEFHQRPGMWPQVITTKSVPYTEIPYSEKHTDCSIRWPSGYSVDIPIKTVS